MPHLIGYNEDSLTSVKMSVWLTLKVLFSVGHVTLTMHHLRVIFILLMGLDIAYMHAEFDYFSFSGSGDMVVAHQNLNGSRDLTTSLSDSLPSMG